MNAWKKRFIIYWTGVIAMFALAGLAVAQTSHPATVSEEALKARVQQIVTAMPNIDQVLNLEAIRPQGTSYEAKLPDTLDLAECARLAINALTQFRPKDAYTITQAFNFPAHPEQRWLNPPNWEVMPKYLRALPLMRAMCGSDQGLQIELDARRAVLSQMREDGHLYTPIAADGPKKDTCHAVVLGLALQAIHNWYLRDGNTAWHAWLRLMGEGLKDNVISKGDYGYIPTETSLGSDGTWHWTLRGDADQPSYMPYQPPNEPIHDTQGQEGAVKFYQSLSLWGLVIYHRRLKRAVDRHGFVGAAALVLRFLGAHVRRLSVGVFANYVDGQFDRKYGTDTSGFVAVSSLDVSFEVKKSAVQYQATGRKQFISLIESLDTSLNSYTFIDFGSGKGRTLLLASDYPFLEIIGVEASPKLHQTAEKNIAIYQNISPRCSVVSSCMADATTFNVPQNRSVYYFYNPFGAEALARVLSRVRQCNAEHLSESFLIYLNPQYRSLIDSSPDWLAIREGTSGVINRGGWVIYRGRQRA